MLNLNLENKLVAGSNHDLTEYSPLSFFLRGVQHIVDISHSFFYFCKIRLPTTSVGHVSNLRHISRQADIQLLSVSPMVGVKGKYRRE